MYILVKQPENIIIGSAIKPIDEQYASDNNITLYEIDDSDFSTDMLGAKLEGFEEKN